MRIIRLRIRLNLKLTNVNNSFKSYIIPIFGSFWKKAIVVFRCTTIDFSQDFFVAISAKKSYCLRYVFFEIWWGNIIIDVVELGESTSPSSVSQRFPSKFLRVSTYYFPSRHQIQQVLLHTGYFLNYPSRNLICSTSKKV